MASQLMAMARRANPGGLAHRIRKEKDKEDKPSLSERIYAAQGYPKFSEDEVVVRLFSKLAEAMSGSSSGSPSGVTDMSKGRDAGAAGVSKSKITGKSLSTQAINPNRSIRSAMTALSPKSR